MLYEDINNRLDKEFTNLLSRYTDFYINYKMDDDNSYLRLEKNLRENKKQMYGLQETIKEDEDDLLKKIHATEKMLRNEKIKNKKLNIQETILDSKDKASYQLLEDKINMYISMKKDIFNYIIGSGCLIYYIVNK